MCYLVTFYFIALDFFTGLLKAFATQSFASHIMRQGLFHKVSLLCVMGLGYLMDYAQRFIDLGVSVPVGAAACVYIALMEAGSILENLCRINPELSSTKLWRLLGMGNRIEAAEQVEEKKQLPMREESEEAEGAEAHEVRH